MSEAETREGVDVYWSFRSPYSYLATKRLRAMAAARDIPIRPRPVYPLAVREPGFFKSVRPQWVPYLITDVVRLADYLGRPIGMLDPDPIVMDLATGEVEAQQPHIGRLTRLGVLAAEQGEARGWAFLDAVSSCIWSGQAWTKGGVLADAVAAEGFDLAVMDKQQADESERLEAVISANETEQAKHHWGVPLMVWRGEAFFGQDRLDLLEWRLDRA
ncbi:MULTISPECIES: 2-hydroxychromene-2-carboxylate isomerase [Hyphobacterium]|uniref:2-hydroxychromene-2-carboxylate isomerase n=1 Tax=Hyphobacterium vulgare TaxID=1736751 RepID=A0ABV6ZT50_9PROT